MQIQCRRNVCYYKHWINIQLTFEDMWLSLQDYFYRLRGNPVVFPYHPMLLLPTFEGQVEPTT